jgi:Nif-specific regulatory protein
MHASTVSQVVPGVELGAARRRGRGQGAEVALYGIHEIAKLLSEPERIEVTLAGVLRVLSSFLDMRHALIALLADGGEPEMMVGSGWTSEATEERPFNGIPERAIAQIVVTAMPIVVGDMRDEPLFEGWDFSDWESTEREIAFVGVPIKDRGKVTGTLTIDRARGAPPYFSLDEDVRFLSMVANLVGQAVRLQRLIARDRARLMEERNRLEKTVENAASESTRQVGGIVGKSIAIRVVLDRIRIVARSHSTVLLRGESGTGKELFARALHDLSPRRHQPLVSVNCAALPGDLLETELFGHERGAFTGALSSRKGRFELADGGTLFLDEIGEISAAFQAKLLRVLQEGEFQRVGGSSTLKVNVRLVAATNKDLEEAVRKGEFRADLYYRISVVPIFLPPLRERPGDILPLASEFLRRFNEEHGTHLALTDRAVGVLTSCSFPGNVRELENCVRRTATLAPGPMLVGGDFACQQDECLSSVWSKTPARSALTGYVPLPITKAPEPGPPSRPRPEGLASREALVREANQNDSPLNGTPDSGPPVSSPLADPPATQKSVLDERGRLVQAMESAGWVQAKAARLLGISARQIGYALRKHDIEIKRF